MFKLKPNEELLEAMRVQQPVVHRGVQYERILDYIFWYDSRGVLRQSVVLLEKNTTVRVLAEEVEVYDDNMVCHTGA